MPRYLRVPKSNARRLGLPPLTTVAVIEVYRGTNDAPTAKYRPTERKYRVTSIEGEAFGFVYSLSGWKMGKHP